ncbi:MAG: acetoin utilization protein AcuC [Promethearchaeota archaeon]
MGKTALIMSGDFGKYNFGKFHPLKPERVLLTWDLIKGLGLDAHENCVTMEPGMATDDEIELLHDPAYVEFVKEVTRMLDRGKLPEKYIIEGFKYNLGPGDNPVFKHMHEGGATVVGATIMATHVVYDDNGIDKAFNASGGLHHAMHDRASGFCIYNDPAIAILHLMEKYRKENLKIMYIDVDAHHGDGVQAAFYSNPDVLTLSIHESGDTLFPGTGYPEEIGEGAGRGFSVNVPLPRYTFDETYADIFDEVVPEVMKVFKPDLIMSQNGVDTHCDDPLTSLGLTTKGHKMIFERINALSEKYCHGRLVAIGGGGYSIPVVPRSWTMLFAELLGAGGSLPEIIPGDVLATLNDGRSDEIVPERFIDKSVCPLIKGMKNNYKFINAQEMYVQEISHEIKTKIIPLIEKRA